MALGGNDMRTDGVLIFISLACAAYLYENRYERTRYMKIKMIFLIMSQIFSGILLCMEPFYSGNPHSSSAFWMASSGAVLWLIFSLWLTLVLYDMN